MMLHPASLDLHRLIVGAAARFPELGQAAYDTGAGRMITDLAALLEERSRSGDGLSRPLTAGEAAMLAEQFIGMLRGFHQVRGLLGITPVPPAERKSYVAACVELLLRAT